MGVVGVVLRVPAIGERAEVFFLLGILREDFGLEDMHMNMENKIRTDDKQYR